MPLNRTNQNVQARTPGMVLTTGNFVTNGVAAPTVLDPEGVDPGVTVVRTGVGTFVVSLPSTGQLGFRDLSVNSFDPAVVANIDVTGPNLVTITTRNGGPSVAGSATQTVANWKEADAAALDTATGHAIFNFPVAGTLTRLTFCPEATVIGVGGDPASAVFFRAGKASGGVNTLLTGTTQIDGFLAPPASYDQVLAWDDMPFNLTVPAELNFLQGETLTINYTKSAVAGLQLPNHVYTAYWTATGGGGGAVPGALIDTTGVTYSYCVWVKNSSAR